MRHKKTVLITLLLTPFFLYGLFLALVVHGDGVRRPSILVKVVNSSGQPVADVTVVFLDRMCLWWCQRNEVAPGMIHDTPTGRLPEMFRLRMSRATTSRDGHAEVRGFFYSARYLWGETLSNEGVVVLARPGYHTLSVGFQDSRFRRQIIKERVTLDLVMNEEHEPN